MRHVSTATAALSEHAPGIFREVRSDRVADYYRVCREHRWASPPAPTVEDIAPCPICDAEWGMRRGRERFEDGWRGFLNAR